MTIQEVITGADRWHIGEGDSLALLREIPDACVDAVVTDPPYSSGGQFRGDRTGGTAEKYLRTESGNRTLADFSGDSRDQRAFGYWCSLWLGECLRVAKPGTLLCAFTDWRQLPTMTDAIQAGGWVWRGIVPWDKTEASRPRMGGFRSQCEYVVWASAGPLDEGRGVGCLPGLLREAAPRERVHQTEKPPGAMLALVGAAAPGGVVLDPFCGSGSTGVAALNSGRRFIGFERVAEHSALSRERLAACAVGNDLAAARAHQTTMFPAACGAKGE